MIRPDQSEASDVDCELECIRQVCACPRYAWKTRELVPLAGKRDPCGFCGDNTRGVGRSPLQALDHLPDVGQADDLLLNRVLYGTFCLKNKTAAAAIYEAIGLPSLTVSRICTRVSAQQRQALHDREMHPMALVDYSENWRRKTNRWPAVSPKG